MSLRVFVPGDAAAVAVGADAVAEAIRTLFPIDSQDLELIRNGSRGVFELEPLLEIEVDGQRIGYGRVTPQDISDLVAQGLHRAPPHPKRLGRVEDIPFLKRQTRLTFARCGVIDPQSLAAYREHGGLAGLQAALHLSSGEIVEAVSDSGLRGRGGAGFPAGVKWNTVRRAEAPQKYVVCNADEGDSGTFADRMLLEGDPFLLIEGMVIAGLATGATQGFVYIRSEYSHAVRSFTRAVATARDAGLLGPAAGGGRHPFDIEVRVGAGAYVCGEETALLESLEGRRGQVRAKPPLPAHQGLFGCPTLINNVLTLAAAPFILAHGAAAYAAHGVGRSRGSMPIQLAGDIRNGGLFETGFGVTLGELVHEIGGGTLSGRAVRAVQVGGPLGAYFPPSLFDTPFDYEAFSERGGLIGHAGVVVFNDTVDLAVQARFALEFCAAESCGKCTPCRLGAVRGMETLDRLLAGAPGELSVLEDLCEVMKLGSLCALGGLTPYPVESALRHFPEDFQLPAARPERVA